MLWTPCQPEPSTNPPWTSTLLTGLLLMDLVPRFSARGETHYEATFDAIGRNRLQLLFGEQRISSVVIESRVVTQINPVAGAQAATARAYVRFPPKADISLAFRQAR